MPSSDVMFARKSRAQSAMEYLMTYGWAILIIAVVLGALFSLGVFSSSSLLGTSCIASSGYYCANPVLSHSTQDLSATLGQSTGATYGNVIFYLVTSGSTYNPGSDPSYNLNGNLQSGQTTSVTFSTLGSTYSTIGTAFTGYLYVNYSTSGSSSSPRNAVAQIATVSVKSS